MIVIMLDMPLPKRDVLKLIGLFVFHWFVILVASVYVFFRTSSKLDWFYLLVTGGTVASWFLVKNECPVSLIEKKILYDNYHIGDKTTEHPSMFLYCKNVYWELIVGVALEFLMGYNIFIMMKIYKCPNWLFVIVIGAYTMLIVNDKIDHIKTIKTNISNSSTSYVSDEYM
jgi:hypothetical protein